MANNDFAARRESVAAGLAERKLDALLVAFSPNLRYLTGFTGSNGSLLLTQGASILFTDPRYTIQAAQETQAASARKGGIRVKALRGPLVAGVVAAISRLGLKRVGYEPARMACNQFDSLKAKLPMRASLLPVTGWIEQLRMVKSAAEIEWVRRSVQLNSNAFEQTVASISPGMTERDLAGELEYRMRRLGAERPAFDTIVAGGVRSALPHAQPTSNPLTRGLVVVDMGAFVEGYASDMTRMLHAGVPGAKVKRAYKAVLEAQLAAIDAIRPGITAGAIDRVARKVLRRYGLDRAFVHSAGHGLGLEIHEPPRLGRNDRTRLQPGMAITVEPGVYLEGWGGIRIEDTVLVTERGCDILTPTSKELRLI